MKGGTEMSKRIFGILLVVLFLGQMGMAQAVHDPNDREGGKDPSLFNRMPGFHIDNYEETEFGRYEFPVGPNKTEAVEGHFYNVHYAVNEGVKNPSGLQVTRNYTNAAMAVGGKKVYEYEDGGYEIVTLKVVKGNLEVWARVEAAGNGMYNVQVVEKQLMKQEVTADAASLAGSIKQTGKASIYGIYFDTGKSEIKPESEPSLKEIAKMVQADSKLKLYVVGHTDNVGTFDSNLKLSKDRADAVVKALVAKYSIAASRLQPFGAGPTAPVSSNLTEEGRAKNRRVELVAQ